MDSPLRGETEKMTADTNVPSAADAAQPPVAVIDIGSTSVRMIIAQQAADTSIRELDFLYQDVSLGKDTFTKGHIEKEKVEKCVTALKSFRALLDEYKIDEERVRAVATTAVREASNMDAFVDRVSIATGITVEPIEATDVARYTYQSFRTYLAQHQALADSNVIIAEVGGGSTELLFLQKGNVSVSQSFRFGTMRMHEMLTMFRTPVSRQEELVGNDIDRTIARIRQSVGARENLNLIALGGDIRFAASQLVPDWNPEVPENLAVKDLAKFAKEVVARSTTDLVRRYHISYADAETVGLALQFYASLAKAFDLKQIILTNISMRHGVLLDMLQHAAAREDFWAQITRSALEIARKYQTDEAHANHVASLCKIIFAALKEEHRLGPWDELLLTVAALLHDIGLFVSAGSHHKHSMYLVQASEVFGLRRKDLLLVSQIVRYHRKAAPQQTHVFYMELDRASRMIVTKCAAILRIADALDRSHSQHIRDISCQIDDGRFIINVPSTDNVALEQLGMQRKGSMFEDVYGMQVVLRPSTAGGA
jgi:exopolyphosphatase / guanosine-5'-triphosphate,3'-diphosphate pyrophosphatase